MTKPDETKEPRNRPPEPGRIPPRERPTVTLGRVVIYCSREGDELIQNVALVVKVHDAGGVDLFVFFQNGEESRVKRVLESEGLEQGRWRWPPRGE